MSATDDFILQFCTNSTILNLELIGGMVTITGVLAFLSASLCIKNSFFLDQDSVTAWLVPIAAAILYALAIIHFDRSIVAMHTSGSKWKSGFLTGGRILIAIVIGIVISYPLELQLQHGRILAEIDMQADTRNKDKRVEIEQLNKENDSIKKSSVETFLLKQKNLEDLIKQELKSAELEGMSEHGLCREICEKHKANAAEYQRQLDQVGGEIKKAGESAIHNELYANNEQSKKELQAAIKLDKARSTDLLSQAVALHSIYKSEAGADAKTIGWFMRIFFVLLELFPVLIKLTMPYTEYHAYLEARMRMNVTKIIEAVNHHIRYLKNNPKAITLEQVEITDLIGDVLEDRAVDNCAEETASRSNEKEQSHV
jgi:hypothetical protein